MSPKNGLEVRSDFHRGQNRRYAPETRLSWPYLVSGCPFVKLGVMREFRRLVSMR